MKKRILALAMTIAMVFSSMAVLSTVSFAADHTEDCVHFDETLPTVPAYMATVAVDGSGSADEPFIAVQQYITSAQVRYGVAWDYDNVYVVLHAYKVGDTTPTMKTATVTVGGVEVVLDVTNKTFEAVDGVKVAFNEAAYIEISVPMTEVSLHYTQTAAFAPLSISLESSKAKGEANVNAELTGKSIFRRDTAYDGADANGYAGPVPFNVVGTASSSSSKLVNTGYEGGAFKLGDSLTTETNVHVGRQYGNMVDMGAGKYNIDIEMDIDSIPLSTVAASWNVNADQFTTRVDGLAPHAGRTNYTYMNDQSAVVIWVDGVDKNGYVVVLFKTNDGTNDHYWLSLGYFDQHAFLPREITSLISSGDYFNLEFTHQDDGGIVLAVNGTQVHNEPYYIADGYTGDGLSGQVGLVTIATMRGHALAENDKFDVKVRNVVFSTVKDVDNSTLKAAQKGEVAPTRVVPVDTAIFSGTAAPIQQNDPAYVDGFTAFWTAEESGWVALNFYVSNYHNLALDFGNGNVANVKLTPNRSYKQDTAGVKAYDVELTGVEVGSMKPEFDRLTGILTVYIPMNFINIYGDAGKAVADLTITETKVWNADSRKSSGLVLTEKVILNFIERDIYSPEYRLDRGTTTATTGGIALSQGYNPYSLTFFKTTLPQYAKAFRYSWDVNITSLESSTMDQALKNIKVNSDSIGYDSFASNGLHGSFVYFTTNVPTNDYAHTKCVMGASTPLRGTVHPNSRYNNFNFMIYNVEGELYLVVGDRITSALSGNTDERIKSNTSRINLGKGLNETFKLGYQVNEDGSATIFVDGVAVGNTPYGWYAEDINGSNTSFVYWSSDAGTIAAANKASSATDATTFTLGDFYYETVAQKAGFDLTATEIIALGTAGNVDVPAYDDVEEAIELNAVQNFGKASDTDYSQRFVATIDTLDYKYAGFQTAKEVTGGYARNTYRVFTGNTSILEGEEEVEAPEGKYFVTYTFDKNSALVNQTFFVRAFVVDADRKFTYGDTYKVTVNAEGQMTSAELVLNPTIFG